MINYHKNFTVTLAGVRGVHPCHGSQYAAYGGTTVCVHTYLQPTGMQPVLSFQRFFIFLLSNDRLIQESDSTKVVCVI